MSVVALPSFTGPQSSGHAPGGPGYVAPRIEFTAEQEALLLATLKSMSSALSATSHI